MKINQPNFGKKSHKMLDKCLNMGYSIDRKSKEGVSKWII